MRVVTRCKYVSGFPEPSTDGEEYKDWRNALNGKREHDGNLGWKGSTTTQWAAIQEYTLATSPVTVRGAEWQTDTAWDEHFTECLDFLLKDIAKKVKPSLTRLLAAPPVPAVAPVAAPVMAPVAVGHDH